MRGGSLTFSGPPTTIWSRGSIWTSESQSQRFFGPIPSLPQPRINTRVVCCKPTPARTRKLHSTPHQTHRITLSGVWLLSWCLRLLCKNKSPSSLWTALGSLGGTHESQCTVLKYDCKVHYFSPVSSKFGGYPNPCRTLAESLYLLWKYQRRTQSLIHDIIVMYMT